MPIPRLVKWKHQIKPPSYEAGKTVQIYAEELMRGLGETAEAMFEQFFLDTVGKMPLDEEVKQRGNCEQILDSEDDSMVVAYVYSWDGKPIIKVRVVRKSTLYLIEGKYL